MAREPLMLDSEQPSAIAPANVSIGHVQLRDLIICPRERGVVNYIQNHSIVEQNVYAPSSTPRHLADLSFVPNTIASLPIQDSGDILLAAGGQDAEVHLSLHARCVPSISPPPAFLSRRTSALWQFEVALPGSINNSVLLTSLSLTKSNESSVEPRVAISNNDCTVKFYDVPVRGQHAPKNIKESGTLRLDVPVNHSSISPDGRTLLSVGDSPKVHIHRLTGGSRITFQHVTSLTLPPPTPASLLNINYSSSSLAASFSTSFSSDGTKFSVGSQEGVVVVWDVRSSKPLKVYQTDKTRCGADGSSGNGAASGYLSDDPWDWTRGGSRAPGWGVRSVKFGPGSSGREVLTFTEHTSLFHVIDARTFETEEIIRVPTFSPSSPRRTPPPCPVLSPHPSRSSLSLHPPPPPRIVLALEDTFRIPSSPSTTSSGRRRHTARAWRRHPEEDVVVIPALGDPVVQQDVQQLLGRHGIRSRNASEDSDLREPDSVAETQRYHRGGDNEIEMEVDELESDCISSHTPSRSSSPSPSSSAPAVDSALLSRYRPRRGTITVRDWESSWENAKALSFGPDEELDLAGCCFDPSGGYLYVASVVGVAEWSVRGAEKRWWGGSHMEWM